MHSLHCFDSAQCSPPTVCALTEMQLVPAKLPITALEAALGQGRIPSTMTLTDTGGTIGQGAGLRVMGNLGMGWASTT